VKHTINRVPSRERGLKAEGPDESSFGKRVPGSPFHYSLLVPRSNSSAARGGGFPGTATKRRDQPLSSVEKKKDGRNRGAGRKRNLLKHPAQGWVLPRVTFTTCKRGGKKRRGGPSVPIHTASKGAELCHKETPIFEKKKGKKKLSSKNTKYKVVGKG